VNAHIGRGARHIHGFGWQRLLARIGIVLAVLLLLVGSLSWWLLRTESGLQFVLARAIGATEGKLSIGKSGGSLAGPAQVRPTPTCVPNSTLYEFYVYWISRFPEPCGPAGPRASPKPIVGARMLTNSPPHTSPPSASCEVHRVRSRTNSMATGAVSFHPRGTGLEFGRSGIL